MVAIQATTLWLVCIDAKGFDISRFHNQIPVVIQCHDQTLDSDIHSFSFGIFALSHPTDGGQSVAPALRWHFSCVGNVPALFSILFVDWLRLR